MDDKMSTIDHEMKELQQKLRLLQLKKEDLVKEKEKKTTKILDKISVHEKVLSELKNELDQILSDLSVEDENAQTMMNSFQQNLNTDEEHVRKLLEEENNKNNPSIIEIDLEPQKPKFEAKREQISTPDSEDEESFFDISSIRSTSNTLENPFRFVIPSNILFPSLTEISQQGGTLYRGYGRPRNTDIRRMDGSLL